MWNVIGFTIDRETNKVVPSKNNPKKSGRYLCTCIHRYDKDKFYRYLQMMEFDKETNSWSDVGHPRAISHVILAWRNDIRVCQSNDFEYYLGDVYKKGELDKWKEC